MSPQELAFRRGKCFIKSVALSGGLELLHCLHRKLCYYFRKSPLVSRGCLEDHFLSLEVETRSVGTLQCSCLENPRDGGAWWAAVYGVAQESDTTEAT